MRPPGITALLATIALLLSVTVHCTAAVAAQSPAATTAQSASGVVQQLNASVTREAASKPKKKKAAKRKTKTPPPAAPVKPKDSWDLPMTAAIVRSSEPGCEPTCPHWISLEGRIVGSSPGVVRKALKQAGKQRLPVLIRSPGGEMNAALEIGRMIRQRKLDVAVGWTLFNGCAPLEKSCKLPKEQQGVYRGTAYDSLGFCNSACPLVLAAGTSRLASSRAYVGVHQVRTTWVQERVVYRERYRMVNGKKKVLDRKIISRKPGKSFEKHGLDKGLRKRLTAYFKEMGIGLGILEDMEKAPPSSIYQLSNVRMEELRLTTSAGSLWTLTAKETCVAPLPAAHCVTRKGVAGAPPAAAADKSKIVALSPAKTAGAEHMRTAEAERQPPMTVAVVRSSAKSCEPTCPQWIAAEGEITAATPFLFHSVLASIGDRRLPVFFNSQGGDADAAIDIGRQIHAKDLWTGVAATAYDGCAPAAGNCEKKSYRGSVHGSGECWGSCLLALAGGSARLAVSGRPLRFGDLYSLADGRDGDVLERNVRKYFEDLRRPASGRAFVHMITNVPLSQRLPSLDDGAMARLDLANNRDSPFSLTWQKACEAYGPPRQCVTVAAP